MSIIASKEDLVKTFADPELKDNMLSVWYHDGTVILRSEGVHFRVYQGILAAKSSFFRNMFAMLQPVKLELPDSCPVLDVQSQPVDIYYLLSALHDHRAFLSSKYWKRFAAWSALLRLGKKYDAEELCEMAMAELRGIFPSSLEDWKNSSPPYPEESIQTLRLAREFGIKDVLPIAAYECLRLGQANDSDVMMTEVDLHFIMKFQQRMAKAQLELYSALLFSSKTIKLCTTSSQCNHKRISHIQSVLGKTGAITIFDEQDKPWRNILCSPCLDRMQVLFDSEIERQWNLLPSICEDIHKSL